jgi:hypothetical protein
MGDSENKIGNELELYIKGKNVMSKQVIEKVRMEN